MESRLSFFRLVTLNGVPYISDIKTTKSEQSFTPNNQFSLYTLAVEGEWPQNETACGHYTYKDGSGGCEFRETCSRRINKEPIE